MRVDLRHGDCRDVLAQLADASVDAVVTDPPYELGFMGRKWDASGIAYSVDLWQEVLRVLKPGGHLLAFGATRTYHRMTCAIEDAGFEIRDSIHWVYGSGFPKSLNIGDGRGTALKPAHEPIVVARKPLIGTVAENVVEWGTGALNIDACRVAWRGEVDIAGVRRAAAYAQSHREKTYNQSVSIGAESRDGSAPYNPDLLNGRWPPNLLFSHLPECGETECAECCAVRELDEQSGVRTSGKPGGALRQRSGTFSANSTVTSLTGYGDSGGASRFFPVFRYQAKTPPKERKIEGVQGQHPTQKPVDLMRWLVRLVTPPNGLVLDPFTGSGTTGVAALLEGFRVIGCEREAEYLAIAQARIAAAEAATATQQPSLFDLAEGA